MRTLSTAATQSIYGQETGEVWLYLLTIAHPEMSTTYMINNTEQITSRGNVHLPIPFDLSIPKEEDGELPSVDIVIDNIGLSLMESIRSISGQPTITMEIVMASDPDTVEVGPFVFSLKNVDYNAYQIRGQISYESFLVEPFNFRKFSPQDFPSVFTTVR